MTNDPYPADPRPTHHVGSRPRRHAARLGLVGSRLQRRSRRDPSARTCCDIVHGKGTHECVPLQGSGTFSVEAAIGTLVPRDGKVLVPNNGAYCAAHREDLQGARPRASPCSTTPRTSSPGRDVEGALAEGPSITHVGAGPLRNRHRRSSIRCRRSRWWCERHGKGLIVDAMSSFGALDIDARKTPIDAVVRRLGQVPRRRAGDGLRDRARRRCWRSAQGNSHSLAMDLFDQWTYMQQDHPVALHAAHARGGGLATRR